MAGPLADYIFEPIMLSSGNLASILGRIFGTGSGAGTALLLELSAGCMVIIGIGSYANPFLRSMESTSVQDKKVEK